MRTLLTAVMNQAQAMGFEVKEEGFSNDRFWIICASGKVLVRPYYGDETRMGIASNALRHLNDADGNRIKYFVKECDNVVFLDEKDKPFGCGYSPTKKRRRSIFDK